MRRSIREKHTVLGVCTDYSGLVRIAKVFTWGLFSDTPPPFVPRSVCWSRGDEQRNICLRNGREDVQWQIFEKRSWIHSVALRLEFLDEQSTQYSLLFTHVVATAGVNSVSVLISELLSLQSPYFTIHELPVSYPDAKLTPLAHVHGIGIEAAARIFGFSSQLPHDTLPPGLPLIGGFIIHPYFLVSASRIWTHVGTYSGYCRLTLTR